MKNIKATGSLKGKTVLLRTDFNVPIKNGKVVDDLRIRAALPTITFLKKQGASVIIVSHAGDDGAQSLFPVAKVLSASVPVRFIKETIPADLHLSKGEVVLLENIRREKGEKKNDPKFAKRLASLADIYVNDAFPVSHRAHASIVGVPKHLPSYAGLQLEKEVAHLGKLLAKPVHPFLVMIGGAKFETKLPLIKQFLKTADHVFVGGALANNFFKTAGFEVGKSLTEGGISLASLLKNKKLLLPVDVVVARNGKTVACALEMVEKGDTIIDAGPLTIAALAAIIKKAKTVLWNGPLGKYEEKGGKKGTETVLTALAKNRTCFSVIGGGDITAVATPAIEKNLSFVSTGGGATLDFLAKGTLPGIKALEQSKK